MQCNDTLECACDSSEVSSPGLSSTRWLTIPWACLCSILHATRMSKAEVMRITRSLVCVVLSFAAPVFASVTVTSPKSGSTVTSPVAFAATATTTTCSKGVASMGIYVNNKLTYTVSGTKLNTTLSLAAGTYSTTVEEWDKCGGASYTKVAITVGTSGGGGGGGSKTAVTVTSPVANTTVASPVSYAATGTQTWAKGVASMG